MVYIRAKQRIDSDYIYYGFGNWYADKINHESLFIHEAQAIKAYYDSLGWYLVEIVTESN